MKFKLMLPILFLAFLLPSCGSTKRENSQSEQIQPAKEKMIPNPPPPLAPGSCKILATVETIDRTLKGTSEKDPCGKAPCSATIKIDSVMGYGSAFPKQFSVGQIVSVRFAHTLNPTKDVWPDVKPALPGLRLNDKFEAIVTGAIAMGSSEPTFTIYGYEKKL